MRAKHVDYILDCIIEKFLSFMNEKDIKEFESKYPDYKYDLEFKNAIKGWSNNKVRREISLCRLIDLIEEKNMIIIQENNLQENIIQENNLQENNLQENNLQENNLQENIIQENIIQENNLQETHVDNPKEE